MPYIYKAAFYCNECGKSLRHVLSFPEFIDKLFNNYLIEKKIPLNRFYHNDIDDFLLALEKGDILENEYSYDSDDWPKYIGEIGECDTVYHCESESDCLNAISLYDYGLKPSDKLYGMENNLIGELISNKLSVYGIDDLKEMLEKDRTPYQKALHEFWREVFSNYLED